MLREISKIFGGGAAAHLLAIAALPLLARLYDPAAYGVYGSLVAALGLAEILFSLRWELALVHSSTREDFRSFSNSFWHLLAATAGSALMLLAIAWNWLPELWRGLCVWLLLLGPLTCLYSLLEMYCVRLHDYRRFTIARIGKVALLVGSQAALALSTSEPGWRQLAAGHLLSLAGAICFIALTGSGGRRLAAHLLPARPFSLTQTRELFRREAGHLRSNAPQALMNAAGQAVPYILLGSVAAPVLGLFAMTDRTIRAPLNLVSSAVKQVVTNRMADQPQQAFPHLKQLLRLLAAGGAAASIAAALFGDMFFRLYLGEQWAGAGGIAFYMTIYAVGALIGLPLLASMRALRRHSTLIAFEAASLAAKSGACWAGLVVWGPLAGIAAYSAASLLVSLIFAWVALGETRRHLVASTA